MRLPYSILYESLYVSTIRLLSFWPLLSLVWSINLCKIVQGVLKSMDRCVSRLLLAGHRCFHDSMVRSKSKFWLRRKSVSNFFKKKFYLPKWQDNLHTQLDPFLRSQKRRDFPAQKMSSVVRATDLDDTFHLVIFWFVGLKQVKLVGHIDGAVKW